MLLRQFGIILEKSPDHHERPVELVAKLSISIPAPVASQAKVNVKRPCHWISFVKTMIAIGVAESPSSGMGGLTTATSVFDNFSSTL